MPVIDQSIVEQQWADLTATERAFERLSNSDLYRKMQMISQFQMELKSYDMNYDSAYCNYRDRWISVLEREEMKSKPMRQT